MVDGDLLLLLTEKELEDDLGMTSGLLRKRFMRELESLKIAADYRSAKNVDLTGMDDETRSYSKFENAKHESQAWDSKFRPFMLVGSKPAIIQPISPPPPKLQQCGRDPSGPGLCLLKQH